MYVPGSFEEDRVPVLHSAIRECGLGTLVTFSEGGLEASHVPMLVDPAPAPLGTLHGHLARANPQWQRVRSSIQALAIFLGPNAYITPSWYATKRETGKVVPTWNYVAIHVYGDIDFFDDPQQLREHIGRLTEAHEAARATPWAVSDAPADYIHEMLAGIVGFRLTIARIEGKWKLSQNRSDQDISGVREGLGREDGHAQKAVADIMSASVKAGH